MSRLVVDTERLQLMVSRMLTDLMRQVSLFVCFLILMIYIDWLLSLFAFVVAPLVVALALTLGRRVRRAGQESQENLEEMSHLLQETIAGHRTVKAFCMEEYEAGRFRELNRLQVRVNVQAARIGALGSPCDRAHRLRLIRAVPVVRSQSDTRGLQPGSLRGLHRGLVPAL